ncbi:MAG: adenylate/guanylate cyclase domain-containing protein [Actinomycetota bacterium]
MQVPNIHYARSADGTHIAYQMAGDGPIDVLMVAPAYSNIELVWTIPSFGPFLTALASIARVICFDPRGAGLSDPLTVDRLPTLEARVADALTVMEAAGSERPALFGMDATGPLAIFFAATYPERTAALILFGTFACGLKDEEYPWAWSAEEWRAHDRDVEGRWGQPDFVESFVRWMAPTARLDRESIALWATYYRQAASPGMAVALNQLERETDVRRVLRTVQAPTLVLHRKDEGVYRVEEGRYMARHIPGARLVELDGADHLPGDGDMSAVIKEVGRFLGSVRDEEASFDRVLASVLFTDIVGSTEKAVELGDRRWRETIEDHHATVRAILARYHGVEIDTAGDSFFATFDGPARAVRCAQAIVDAVRALELEVRVGVRTGEVETIDGKVGGIAVNIGARVGGIASPSEVLVSSTVKDLVAGSGLVFQDRGDHDLKGIPDRWHLYGVVP